MQEWLTRSIHEMDWIDFWPVAAACALIAGKCLFNGFEYWRSARLLEDYPRSRSRSAAQGYVQMVGTVQDHESLPQSPLGFGRVAWWSLTVRKMPRSSGQASGLLIAYWLLAFFFERIGIERHEQSCNRFRIKDDDGECEIAPAGAHVIAANERTVTGSVRMEISAADRVRGNMHATPGPRLVETPDGNAQHVHRWLCPGERIYVLGEFESLQDTSTPSLIGYNGLQNHGAAVLAEWTQDQNRLLERFDEDGNGLLDAREWTRVRRAAITEARLRLSGRDRRQVVHRLRKPQSERSFLIVSLDDPALGPALRRRATAWLLGFFLLGALTTGAIDIRIAGIG